MKLRLQKNSLRLRLSPKEISELGKNGFVSENIQFTQTQALLYTIRISDETKELKVSFSDKEIVVKIPFETARHWTETNLIGIEHEQLINQNMMLKILIEKDFLH